MSEDINAWEVLQTLVFNHAIKFEPFHHVKTHENDEPDFYGGMNIYLPSFLHSLGEAVQRENKNDFDFGEIGNKVVKGFFQILSETYFYENIDKKVIGYDEPVFDLLKDDKGFYIRIHYVLSCE